MYLPTPLELRVRSGFDQEAMGRQTSMVGKGCGTLRCYPPCTTEVREMSVCQCRITHVIPIGATSFQRTTSSQTCLARVAVADDVFEGEAASPGMRTSSPITL